MAETRWFVTERDGNPHRIGVYAIVNDRREQYFSLWDGTRWHSGSLDLHQAARGSHRVDSRTRVKWKGCTTPKG